MKNTNSSVKRSRELERRRRRDETFTKVHRYGWYFGQFRSGKPFAPFFWLEVTFVMKKVNIFSHTFKDSNQ